MQGKSCATCKGKVALRSSTLKLILGEADDEAAHVWVELVRTTVLVEPRSTFASLLYVRELDETQVLFTAGRFARVKVRVVLLSFFG